jgi:NADPH:quinone reductase-like Zn-dependent oxidoreductase
LSGHWGGFAEYVCANEKELAIKPAGMRFEEAAGPSSKVNLNHFMALKDENLRYIVGACSQLQSIVSTKSRQALSH